MCGSGGLRFFEMLIVRNVQCQQAGKVEVMSLCERRAGTTVSLLVVLGR